MLIRCLQSIYETLAHHISDPKEVERCLDYAKWLNTLV